MGEGTGVDDVLGSEPALAGNGDAEIEEAEMLGFMGIGVDATKDAEIPGFVPPAPIEIEGQVPLLDAVFARKHLAKQLAGFFGQPGKSGIRFQSGENLGLGEGAGGKREAEGVEMHE